MRRAHLCPGPIHLEGPWWPSMPRAHPFLWHIHPQDPLGPIHAEDPSLPSAHQGTRPMYMAPPGSIGAHPYRRPIPAQCPSIPRAQGPPPSIPRAHPCPGPIRGPMRPNYTGDPEGPSMPRAYTSGGLIETHLYQGPILAEGPYLLRAHLSSSMPKAHPCPGHIHPVVLWGPSIPWAHPCRMFTHPEGP